MLEGAQLVQQAAQCPDVAFLVVGLLLAQLGRQVEGRAYHRMGEVVRVQHLGHAEVANLDHLVLA